TTRENPAAPTRRARCTLAIPPRAISSKRRYRPTRLGAELVESAGEDGTSAREERAAWSTEENILARKYSGRRAPRRAGRAGKGRPARCHWINAGGFTAACRRRPRRAGAAPSDPTPR